MDTREEYLENMRNFYNEKNLIKIIYGLKGYAKADVLVQMITEISDNHVKPDHIKYINLKSPEYADVINREQMEQHIMQLVKDNQTYYIMLDEVQVIPKFEQGINNLRETGKFSIFITGSNSRDDLKKLYENLSGTYVSFRALPFEFQDDIQFADLKSRFLGLFKRKNKGKAPRRRLH